MILIWPNILFIPLIQKRFNKLKDATLDLPIYTFSFYEVLNS